MRFPCGLALHLLHLLLPRGPPGAPGSAAGPSTSRPGPVVTANHVEEAAMTPGVRTNSEGAFQTADLVETSVPSHIPLETQTLSPQTFDGTLILANTNSEAETRDTKTTFPAMESRTFTKMTPSKFTVVITRPMEASATSGNPVGTGMTTFETVTGSDLAKSVFDALCTDDSSEEAKRIIIDVLTLAPTSVETEGLALESSAFSDSSVLAITAPWALAPDKSTPAKGLFAYSITDIEVANCSILEIETTATTLGTLDMDLNPTGGEVLSPPVVSALLNSTEAESHLTETTPSAETLSAASATEAATPDTTVETPLTADSPTEGEATAATTTTPSTTLVSVSMNPLEEASVPSMETTSHSKVLGAVTVSTEAGLTVGKATSPAGLSTMAYSYSHTATSKSTTPSQPYTTGGTTNESVPITRSPAPSVQLARANSSQEANITLFRTTALAKTLKTASVAGGKTPTAMPTAVQTRWTTEATADGDGGFFLLRLSVASPEDLTDPRVAERLVQQLCRELHAHLPPARVSLLHVTRG
ncbi:mucin-20 isoform X2 [Vulpes lagopus]|uniref:mucin-20 isoform X2 n=1 Tax=Vulpes lagopus TaxID=494514 RepID=UPI001BCA52A2|nr:mucin-20 isoform X2 [Vulpes lagopus]